MSSRAFKRRDQITISQLVGGPCRCGRGGRAVGRQIRRSDRGPPSKRRAGAYDPVGSSCYGPSLLVIAKVAIAPEPRRVRRAAPATSPGGPRDRHASDAPWTGKSMRPLARVCQDSRRDSRCDFTSDRHRPPHEARCPTQRPRMPSLRASDCSRRRTRRSLGPSLRQKPSPCLPTNSDRIRPGSDSST